MTSYNPLTYIILFNQRQAEMSLLLSNRTDTAGHE